LLLGPPSSGKTTLLLALAGRLDPNLKVNKVLIKALILSLVLYLSVYIFQLISLISNMRVEFVFQCSGKVTYNGHAMHEFKPQRTAAYISQYDVHIAEMTVRETLAFSARLQGVGWRHG
jgi:ABC-type multidrug transport system ATPase subunit